MEQQAFLYIIAALLMVAGVIGTILPALPGVPMVFAGMLLAAWANGFQAISIWTVLFLGLLTLLSFVIDFWSTAMGAKRVGASRKAVFGAMAGMLVGLFFGPIGLFIGAFVGALIGELWHLRKLDKSGFGQATKVGIGTWLGMALGIVLKLTLAFSMIGLFLLAWNYF